MRAICPAILSLLLATSAGAQSAYFWGDTGQGSGVSSNCTDSSSDCLALAFKPASGASAKLVSRTASTGSAVGVIIDTEVALNTLGDVPVSFRSGGVEYASFQYDGTLTVTALKPAARSIFTCSSGSEGTKIRVSGTGGNTGVQTKDCECFSNGSNVYRWKNLISGTISTAANACDP